MHSIYGAILNHNMNKIRIYKNKINAIALF